MTQASKSQMALAGQNSDTQKIVQMIETMEYLIENEQDVRNSLADRLEANQKLPTSEARLNNGFTLIYGDLESSKWRLENMRKALLALRSLL